MATTRTGVAGRKTVGARQLEDSPCQLEVLELLAAADVVDLAALALAQHDLDRLAVILDVQPVARLPPVAVERQRLAVERVRDEERDHLLRVLVRSVRVRPA